MSTERRERVLVVDDDVGLQHVVKRILGRRYEVLEVSDPAEATEVAKTFRPHLALLDIYMPQMNGFELMGQLKELQPDLDVIVMTGDTAEPDSNLVRAIQEGAYYFIQKPFDRLVMLTLVGRCLELRALRAEKQRHLQRLEEELHDAQQFQLSFLPDAEKEFRGLRISARYLACHELAGDFFDYAEVGDNSVALLVADVVGHGTSAAMMTGVVKSAFHAAHIDQYRPASVIEHLRTCLGVFEDSRFVTVFCARIDPQAGRMEYTNAGHPPAVLRRSDGSSRLLEATSPLVCSAFGKLPIEQGTADITSGDSLLIYTDGVAEAVGSGEMFGHARVRSIATNRPLRGPELLDSLLLELSTFTQDAPYDDDVTIMSVEVL